MFVFFQVECLPETEKDLGEETRASTRFLLASALMSLFSFVRCDASVRFPSRWPRRCFGTRKPRLQFSPPWLFWLRGEVEKRREAEFAAAFVFDVEGCQSSDPGSPPAAASCIQAAGGGTIIPHHYDSSVVCFVRVSFFCCFFFCCRF